MSLMCVVSRLQGVVFVVSTTPAPGAVGVSVTSFVKSGFRGSPILSRIWLRHTKDFVNDVTDRVVVKETGNLKRDSLYCKTRQ